MQMPGEIGETMLAPCGMDCAVCYKHVGIRKYAKPRAGCLQGDIGKPEHCRTCKIISCAHEKGHTRCLECMDFPCKLIKNMEKSYRQRYGVSLVENSLTAREKGVAAFLEQDRARWTCTACGGAFSLHDDVCSECGEAGRKE